MSSPSNATNPRRSPCSATVLAEMRDVQVPYGATTVTMRGLTYRFFDDLRPPLRDPFRGFARARVAEAAGSQRDTCCAGHLLDTAVVNEMSLRIVEVHGDRPAA